MKIKLTLKSILFIVSVGTIFLHSSAKSYSFEPLRPLEGIRQMSSDRDIYSLINVHKSKMQSTVNQLDQLQGVLENDLNELKTQLDMANERYKQAKKNYKFVKSELKSVKRAKGHIEGNVNKNINNGPL